MPENNPKKLILTDFYEQPTERLLASFKSVGIAYKHVNITYDGFLPNETLNPFAELLGAKGMPDKDLHFNQVKVPKFDEINHASSDRSEILNGDIVVGYINYVPDTWRIVREVVWLSRSGTPTIAHRYNRQGFKYAEVLFNHLGKEAKILYFNAEGKQVLTVDTVHQVIIRENQIFQNLTEFVTHYLSGILDGVDEIIFNSLSTPLFVANRLTNVKSSLYFQENIQKEIPGNMQQILSGKSSANRILFENAREMAKVQRLMTESVVPLEYLGAIEKIKDGNKFRPAALTITRSDEILHDEAVVKVLADLGFKWTIAAPTEASVKLRNFATQHKNVNLMEVIKDDDLPKLLADNDFYLDINKGGDWGNAVQQAYFEGLLVVADKKVAKNGGYELILEKEEEIIDVLKRDDKARILQILHEKKGKAATVADYHRLLD